MPPLGNQIRVRGSSTPNPPPPPPLEGSALGALPQRNRKSGDRVLVKFFGALCVVAVLLIAIFKLLPGKPMFLTMDSETGELKFSDVRQSINSNATGTYELRNAVPSEHDAHEFLLAVVSAWKYEHLLHVESSDLRIVSCLRNVDPSAAVFHDLFKVPSARSFIYAIGVVEEVVKSCKIPVLFNRREDMSVSFNENSGTQGDSEEDLYADLVCRASEFAREYPLNNGQGSYKFEHDDFIFAMESTRTAWFSRKFNLAGQNFGFLLSMFMASN